MPEVLKCRSINVGKVVLLRNIFELILSVWDVLGLHVLLHYVLDLGLERTCFSKELQFIKLEFGEDIHIIDELVSIGMHGLRVDSEEAILYVVELSEVDGNFGVGSYELEHLAEDSWAFVVHLKLWVRAEALLKLHIR